MTIRVERFPGKGLERYIDELARLRIAVFREFPYLYDGSLDYERKYLKTYIGVADSVIVLALDEARVVGASTGLPMEAETEEVKKPFKGQGIKVFETRFGRIAINVCYDVEFPLIARAQAKAGADLILTPSCTDTLAGYHRVRIGCQARALENQCYVAQAPTVGEAPWSEAVDVNVGAAGIYAPPDRGMPDNGVLTVGELNRPQWVFADLDFEALRRVRDSGQVFNARDWDNQRSAVAAVRVCPL